MNKKLWLSPFSDKLDKFHDYINDYKNNVQKVKCAIKNMEIDNENDDAKWEKEIEENDEDRDEMFYAVRDSFERLSTDLGGDYFMSVTADYIKKFMNSSNWIEVHASYTAMAYMSEGCKESFKNNIQEILNYISQGLTHNHPRVRYVVLSAFGLNQAVYR